MYRLTHDGRDEFAAWMRELVSEPDRGSPRCTAALVHLAYLPAAEARDPLQARVPALEADPAKLRAPLRAAGEHVERLILVEIEYASALRRAELNWLRSLVAELRAGRLDWGRSELKRRYRIRTTPADRSDVRVIALGRHRVLDRGDRSHVPPKQGST